MAKTFGEEEKEEDEGDDSGGGRRRRLLSSNESSIDSMMTMAPEEIREEAEEGAHLYLEFIRAEIEHRVGVGASSGFELPMGYNSFQQSSSSSAAAATTTTITPERLDSWTRAGRDLRQMADAFASSKERNDVKRQAQSIQLKSLDSVSFLALLRELFQGGGGDGGVTTERILVLFFFCADLAIEALRQGYSSIHLQIIQWSLKYISTAVARWVHAHGGWAAVLQSSLHIAIQVSLCIACVAFAAACFVYCKRNG